MSRTRSNNQVVCVSGGSVVVRQHVRVRGRARRHAVDDLGGAGRQVERGEVCRHVGHLVQRHRHDGRVPAVGRHHLLLLLERARQLPVIGGHHQAHTKGL